MKYLWREAAAAVLVSLLIPALMLNTARLFTAGEAAVEALQPAETNVPVQPQRISITVSVDGTAVQMDLEDYLVGVVLGEMPAAFDPEALKAQAVVARTYTLRMCETSSKHDGAAVCTSAACCQAYCAAETYLSNGGTQDSVDKITQAVNATARQVLTYEGKLIEATYFASSGGRTEDALAVWGSDVPYLQATDSPEEAYAAEYTDTVTLTLKEFQDALDISLKGPSESWLGTVTYTNGGGVDVIIIGGVAYKGTEIRKLLGLRSTAFTMTAVGEHITITTRGYGHRVGMSQYGAEAMAVSGSTYDEILAHYYQGTVLEEYVDIG